jgi:3-deoxy-D-manno-octulosonic-acid transferase
VPGQIQYAPVFAKIYPSALIVKEFPSLPLLVDQFLYGQQVKLCIFIEGPSLHGFFPIRQDLALSAGCLWHNIPLFVVNACLYDKSISSRFDLIEHKLFSNILQEAVLKWYLPNLIIHKDFLDHGISQHKLLVTGDIKLDNIFSEPLPPISVDLSDLFETYAAHNCRLIVAGSVNEYEEQVALIHAWSIVRVSFPDVVLVLVPRYINNQSMMERLYQFLENEGIPYSCRSQGMNDMIADKLLVVDVFGELPYFYEYAEIAFAGRGHGVLEPMKFSKPVVVGPRSAWQKVGSTAYHLFIDFLEKNSLIECENYERLSDLFIMLLKDTEYGAAYIKRYTQIIQEQMGASDRIINHICQVLPNLQSRTD